MVWDAQTGEPYLTLPGDSTQGTVVRASFSPDSQRLAVANQDGYPRVWDLASGVELLSLQGHVQVCDAIAFSPDGRQLATVGADGYARIWDASTGQLTSEVVSFEPLNIRTARGWLPAAWHGRYLSGS